MKSRRLLHERALVEIVVATKFLNQTRYHWQDLAKTTILKSKGTSDKTLSSVLNSWIGQGILRKEKEPFPFNVCYVLKDREKLVEIVREYRQLRREANDLLG